MHSSFQVVSDTIRYRLENNLRRSDFLQLLLDARLQEQTNNNKGNGSTDINSKKASNEGTVIMRRIFFIRKKCKRKGRRIKVENACV